MRDFVDDTSTTSDTLFPVSSLGDQCISGDISVQDPIVKSDEEELVDADTYIS